MYEDIIEIKGNNPGPTSMILAGVHGNERCGVEALEKILPTLVIENGRVFIGHGNPRAIEQNVRFTEANLNRMFKADSELTEVERGSYEYARAQFLKKYLDQADALLDIHASSVPNSKRFVICEDNAKGIVGYLPVDLRVSGFDDVEPGGTDYYMNSIGKIGICLECAFIGDPESARIAETGIVNFLAARGHTSNKLGTREQSHIRIYKKYFSKTEHFVLSKQFENFERLEENQLIGIDGQKEIRAEKMCRILFAHNGKKANDEVFLLGEELV